MARKRYAKIVRLLDSKSKKVVREKVLDGAHSRDMGDHADCQWGEKNTRGLITEIVNEQRPEFTKAFSFGRRP